METRRKILIVGFNQLDSRYLHNECMHLSVAFEITILSPDEGFKKKSSKRFRTICLKKNDITKSRVKIIKKIQTFFMLIRTLFGIKKHLEFENYDLIYIRDQTWAFALKILLGSKHKYVMQMYAPGVTPSKIKNVIHDLQVMMNVRFFDHVFIGSERAKRVFKVPDHKAYITGVGVEAPDFRIRKFDEINLVYLGMLSNRFIHETVKGFADFYRENKDSITMRYCIIGDGYVKDVNELKKSIAEAGDDIPIEYLGRLDDDLVRDVFMKSNVGVVYNRVSPYYTNNISTKLYEYLLSGMPVIAVKNKSLLDVVNIENGVLIDDTPDGFKRGLKVIWANLNKYNSSVIARSGEACSVERVVQEKMIPYFNTILGE